MGSPREDLKHELEVFGLRSVSSIKGLIDKMAALEDRDGLEWAIRTLRTMGSEQALGFAEDALRKIR